MGGTKVVVGECFGGRYRLERVLGRGGMAAVYVATDLNLERLVALKVFDPGQQTIESFEVAQTRFLREARALASIDSPYVVPVYDVGAHESKLYIVTKILEGDTLGSLANSLRFSQIVSLICDLLSGLGELGRRDLVHRDVKPANVVVVNGCAVLIDLGLVMTGDDRLTGRHQVLGTPPYMSPEHALGCEPTHQSDLYSAALLLLVLTSRCFELVDGDDSVFRRLDGDGWLDEFVPKAPGSIRGVLRHGLAFEPKERFQSAAAFRTALIRVNQL